MGRYFDDKDAALQSLCNMAECRAEFDTAFPDINMEAECATVESLVECKFDLREGPTTIPMNLGFVTDSCCAAAISHSSSRRSNGDEAETAMNVICKDISCIAAYDSLFQQGQSFADSSSTATLEEVCSPSMDQQPTTTGGTEDEGEELMDDASAGVLHFPGSLLLFATGQSLFAL